MFCSLFYIVIPLLFFESDFGRVEHKISEKVQALKQVYQPASRLQVDKIK
jgi:hypothetical protein